MSDNHRAHTKGKRCLQRGGIPGCDGGGAAIAAQTDSANKGTTMNKSSINAIAIAVGFAFSAGAMAQTMSKEEYKSAKEGIAAEYKSAKAACGSFSGNAKDLCKAEASGTEAVEKAELEARYKPSVNARYKVRLARADADYAIAKEKCDDLAGNVKDVCVKEAKANAIAAKADAKAQMQSANANETAAETSAKANRKARAKGADARQDAASDKRDADYAVAKERCDAFAGDAKASCLNEAKARFGK